MLASCVCVTLATAGRALGSTVGATSSRSAIGDRFANATHNGTSAQVLGGYPARGHQLGWWRGHLSTTRGYAGKTLCCGQTDLHLRVIVLLIEQSDRGIQQGSRVVKSTVVQVEYISLSINCAISVVFLAATPRMPNNRPKFATALCTLPDT